MKYKPSRDIPKAVRELKDFSPSKISVWIREHRTEKDKKTGKRRQVERTPESVTMWFKDHPDVLAQLKSEIVEEELPKTAISETLFENGVFQELESVKTWIRDLTLRNAKEETITGFVSGLKRVCQGLIGNGVIEGYGLKHPDRLTLEDAKDYLFHLKKYKGMKKSSKRQYRLILRNFLTSQEIVVKDTDISGRIEVMGQYAHLYAPPQKLYAIFDYVKALNKEAYFAAKFAFKCGGARKTATLAAQAKDIHKGKSSTGELVHSIIILEKASKGKEKRRVEKIIPEDFYEEMKEAGLFEREYLFSIDGDELNGLLRAAYAEVIPEQYIPMPLHYMRHQFAQHMLRATGWNYGVVAALGHWTVQTLERYYGKPPIEEIREFGLEFLPKI